MSPKKNQFEALPFPPEPPPPVRLTLPEIKELGAFFKGLLEETKLTKWIIWAGIGGIVELARLLIDAVKIVLQIMGHQIHID